MKKLVILEITEIRDGANDTYSNIVSKAKLDNKDVEIRFSLNNSVIAKNGLEIMVKKELQVKEEQIEKQFGKTQNEFYRITKNVIEIFYSIDPKIFSQKVSVKDKIMEIKNNYKK